MVKLNLGSHNKDIGNDYINIDILEFPNVDAICDLSVAPFNLQIKHPNKFEGWDLFEDELSGKRKIVIKDDFIDYITMVEVLEHISFRATRKILKEIYRILKVSGMIRIQVPDCGVAMRAYVENRICNCVPHKPENDAGFVGKKDCQQCHGTAIMDWERWLFSFTGAQKHEYDTHKAIFTREFLEEELRIAGFCDLKFIKSPVKLIVEATK